MKVRDNLKEIAALTGDKEVFSEYKKKRNEVSTKLKTAKATYYTDKFKEESSTPADMWRTAYQVIGNFHISFPSLLFIFIWDLFGSRR